MPSKNEIWSAKVAHLVHQAAQFGLVTGPVAIDMATVRQRKRAMVDAQIAAHLQNYKTSGAALIMGTGRFVAPKTLEVCLNDGGTRLLAGDQVFLNVGTHAAMPRVPGLEAARPLTHIEALELDYLPPHLLVLGGGYVGLELAQAYRRFGSRVTVIEHGPQLMGREDRDVLVATGRIPNTADIGLDKAGVELDAHRFVRVNDRLETSAPDVWAIGECAGSPQFTHVSEDDFRIIRDNLAGGTRTTHDRLVPYCMFTDPPLARVGLSEAEAQRQDVDVRVARLPMSRVLRAQTTGETQGFMKALVGARHDRILGFTMIGADAGEVVATVQAVMLAELPYSTLRDAVLAHPTMAEGLGPLLSNVPPRAE